MLSTALNSNGGVVRSSSASPRTGTPALSPALWICLGEVGEAVANTLGRWVGDRESPSARVTRIVRSLGIPPAEPDDDPLYKEVRAAIEQIAGAPELRDNRGDDLVVPQIWVVCDLNARTSIRLVRWLQDVASRLRAEGIVTRVSIIGRHVRWNTGLDELAMTTAAIGALVRDVASLDSPLFNAFRVFVATDRDRRGSLYQPDELIDAIRHFAEFVYLAKAPDALPGVVAPLFKPGPPLPPGRHPWEHLLIFGSISATRIEIDGADAKSRIDPRLRKRVGQAIAAEPPPTWVPPVPSYQPVDFARGIQWKPLDLPSWRPRQWEGPRTEARRLAAELDRWLEDAVPWRQWMLVTYIEAAGRIDLLAERARDKYLLDLDQIGATILHQRDLPGGIQLLERLVERASAELRLSLAETPDIDPDIVVPRSDSDVRDTIPSPEVPIGAALDEVGARIARRVAIFPVTAVFAICALVAWYWTRLAIRHWDDSVYGWIADLNLPVAVRDPILRYLSRVGNGLRQLIDSTPLASLTAEQWVAVAIGIGAVTLAILVLLWDRRGIQREVKIVRKRIRDWRDAANRDLPRLLAIAESRANRAAMERLLDDLADTRVHLQTLTAVAREDGRHADPDNSRFSRFVRLAGPAFSPITERDVDRATVGVRQALADRWRWITPDAFAKAILDQEEPITARGGRAVHDPRAELEPLVAAIDANLPNRSQILLPPVPTEAADLPVSPFGRIVSIPARSASLVDEALRKRGITDVTVLEHEPERVGFVVGIDVDIAARSIFGAPPAGMDEPVGTPRSPYSGANPNGDQHASWFAEEESLLPSMMGEQPFESATENEGQIGSIATVDATATDDATSKLDDTADDATEAHSSGSPPRVEFLPVEAEAMWPELPPADAEHAREIDESGDAISNVTDSGTTELLLAESADEPATAAEPSGSSPDPDSDTDQESTT